jgi:hypothetical protein
VKKFTYLREMTGDDGAAGRLLIIVAYKRVALVLEVPDLQDLSVQLKQKKIQPFYICTATKMFTGT